MEKLKFDYVILNSPFSVGGKIIETVLPYCNEASVLMPFSEFKPVHKHVKEITRCEWSGDAAITNLCYATMDNNYYNNCYIMEPFVKRFLEEHKNTHYPDWLRVQYMGVIDLTSLDIDTDVIVPGRLFENCGFGRTSKAVDYQFNILYNVVKPTYYCAVIHTPDAKTKAKLAKYCHFDPDYRKRLTDAHMSGANKIFINLMENIFENP